MAWKDLTTDKKIVSAKASLMFNHPFFATLASRLTTIEDPAIRTMATDGRHLIYSPDFVDGLNREELTFVLAHEVMHNALEHHCRRQSRDPKRWNIACDYAINGELEEAGVGKMPKCGLIDPTYTGRAAEEIYALLPEDSGGKGDGQDPGGCGGVLDAAGPGDQAALKEAAAEVRVAVRQAANAATGKMAGSMPESMKKLIEKLLAPVVDWQAVLRRFIDENSNRTDYAWTRPNRRMLPHGLILPGQISDGISHIVIICDTSGSIYGEPEALNRFNAEINGAFGDGMIDKITVVYADARVSSWHEFQRGDEVKLEPTGGGGTAFADSFRWVAENANDASAVIYLTDLYVNEFGDEPHCPVMWAVYGDSRNFADLAAATPFGEAISLAA